MLFGVWYACKGELFLFLLSALVAIQHECAHAFCAYKLGYKLNKIVLMPFGAVIDGEMKGISLKDEIFVAFCGPFCNLLTAALFVAIWWIAPTMYAFTDTACYSSLTIALVNLLPAYPLDGGRILRCVLAQAFLKSQPQEGKAEKKAEKICKIVTFCFSALFLAVFFLQLLQKTPNLSLLAFGIFLLFGGLGNGREQAVYDKIDFSLGYDFKKGVEIRRVAVPATLPVKDALKFIAKGRYLIVEGYDEYETRVFTLSQRELSLLFLSARSPYETLQELQNRGIFSQKS